MRARLRDAIASWTKVPANQIAFTRALLDRNPGLHAVRAALGAELLAEADLDGAVAECSAALAGDASLIQAWLVRATANRALRNTEAAAADFLHAAELAPDRPMILVNLANSYAEMDRLGAAETCLRRAVALDPRCIEALSNLGSVLVRLDRLADAEAPCRAALALDPGLVRAHQNLSGILAETDPQAARAHRDAAYRRQQIFIETAARPELTILVLAAADAANVPLNHLLPAARFTLIHWYVEYASEHQDRDLPAHDLVFNAIGDPDLAPCIPPPAIRALRARPERVLNDPSRVARTSRSDLPGLLAGLSGIVVPKVIRHDGGSSLKAALAKAEIACPVLLRPLGSHGGAGVRRIDDADDLEDDCGPAYVTRFIDFSSEDGWFRKYRMIFVDGRVHPYHLAISPDWLVHYWTAGMDGDTARRDEERGFLADPASAIGAVGMAALATIATRLGLDYGGIDFGLLRDGQIVVFEANATMLVHPERDERFVYRNDAVEVILAAFRAMLTRRAGKAPTIGTDFSSSLEGWVESG